MLWFYDSGLGLDLETNQPLLIHTGLRRKPRCRTMLFLLFILRSNPMRKCMMVILLCSLPLLSQMAPAPAAKPPVKKPMAAAPAQPTAIIDTTAGKLTCVLFPDKAPIGVANFIGLATGTKDWTSPATGRKTHGE